MRTGRDADTRREPRDVSRRGASRAWARRAGSALLVTALAAGADAGLPADTRAAAPDWQRLLRLAGNRQEAREIEPEVLQTARGSIEPDAPLWPVHTFLDAEIERLRGNGAEARERYQRLVEWAAKGPFGDRSGGCGLAGVALWRLAKLRGAEAPSLKELDEWATVLFRRPLVERMFQGHPLPSLPQMREEIALELARRAWKEKTMDASDYVLAYVKATTGRDLDPEAQDWLDALAEQQVVDADHIALLRAQQFLRLANFVGAEDQIRRAEGSRNPEVLAEAALMRANLQRRRGDDTDLILDTLNALLNSEPAASIAEAARFTRGLTHKRDLDSESLRTDFGDFIALYPGSRRVDSAHLELARDYQMAGEYDQAVRHFDTVLEIGRRWQSTAKVQRAFTLYSRARGDPEGLRGARGAFQDIYDEHASGPYRRLSTFWLGRIDGELGDREAARAHFQDLVATDPFGYYGVRSRIHLESLDSASPRAPARATLLPRERGWAIAAPLAAVPDAPPLPTQEPEQARLAQALDAGLYAAALGVEAEIRGAGLPSPRIEEIALSSLDEAGWLPRLGLLLALRQDALRASRGIRSPGQLLTLAARIGPGVGDWPVAISMVFDPGADVQTSAGYLAIAYPRVFTDAFQAARAQAAPSWEGLPSLLYSLARRESLFLPTAVSTSDAIGLLQITSRAFDRLKPSYELVRQAGARNSRALLLIPDQNIRAGALLMSTQLLPAFGGAVVPAIMAHNAGEKVVKAWLEQWDGLGRADDLEFMVETARATQTRLFTRGVLTDLAIADALGLLRGDRPDDRTAATASPEG
jgi:tetratricopeptide (TPR) repeat protein